ncbi:MAG: hypothetical protein FJX60_21925 [Alphaproteobacteria bacterium]|nr:hypothetical protein [Alphaproteobacteria bacterium]
MVEQQDTKAEAVSPPMPVGPAPVAAPPQASWSPRRRALLAGAATLAVAGSVVALLSPMLVQLSARWEIVAPPAVSPVAAQTPPAAASDNASRERLRAQIATDRARLHQFADQAVATAVAIEFGAMRLRAPAYADWAYGWVQSYVTSYQIIGRALTGALDHWVFGGPGSIMDAATNEASNVVREHFQRLVVQPELTQKALDIEWSRVTDLLNREFDAVEARQSAALVALTGRWSVTEAQSLRPISEVDALSIETPDINAVLVRSARPMAARAGIIALRLTEIGSVAAIVGSLGISFGPLTGIVVGVGGGLVIAWGIDYVINLIDAELHRDELVAHMTTFVDALESETHLRLATLFRDQINKRFLAIEATLNRAFP